MSSASGQAEMAAAEGGETSSVRLAETFLHAFRHHPSGVAILTADPGDGPVALTVSSLISLGLTPPTVAFSLSNSSSSARAMQRAETVVVHFARRKDMQLARLCATSGTDRFGPGIDWQRLETGEPYYPQVDLWFRAVIRGRLPAPEALLVTAEFLAASPNAGGDDEPLAYADRTWHGLRPIVDTIRTPLHLWPDESARF